MLSFSSFDHGWLSAFFINIILISIAQRFPLLTRSGWVHAGALGTILWGCLGWRGWLAVVIYLLLGSLVTKLGFETKLQAGIAEPRGGCRGPENLWGSAAAGAVLAILVGAKLGSEPLLLVGFASSFSAKLADTFGSEIGKRWGSRTYLITSLRTVPAGTDGGISVEGTFASAFGSLLMTVVLVALFHSEIGSFAGLVFFAGLVATLFESFLGALVQQRISWLTNEVVNGLQTSFAALMAMAIASRLV